MTRSALATIGVWGTVSDEGDGAFFDGLDDGCGCVEFWEYVSERRSSSDD